MIDSASGQGTAVPLYLPPTAVAVDSDPASTGVLRAAAVEEAVKGAGTLS